MEVNEETHGLFSKAKCGFIHMNPNEHLYDTPSGDFVFFFPQLNKIRVNKVIGIDKEMNIPIIDIANSKMEFIVKNNEELKTALEIIVGI